MAYNKEIEAEVDRLYDGLGLESKKMFGGVGYKIRGNMCFGILGNDVILRLGQERADEIISKGIGNPFSSPGRSPMKGWATVDWGQTDKALVRSFLNEAYEFALSLPEK
jgi:TfoX/Sxy family transcriptional regulator of competence genes